MHKPIRKPSTSPAEAVTLEDVAQRAGVSPSTVSRYLNDTAVVSDVKRAAIKRAIDALSFVPNPVARGLASGRSMTIGVLTQSLDSPYYGTALRGIEDGLEGSGYGALFASGRWDPAVEQRCVEVLRARRVDGLIVLTGRLPDRVLRAIAKSMPLVLTGRALRAPGLVSLDIDNHEGARLATEHLVELGHRRIAFITGDPGQRDSTQRLEGYKSALNAARLRFDPALVVEGDFSEESGVRAIEALTRARTRFTAVFASNDQMAFGAALALHRRGLRVPHDVSLVGFDDIPSSRYTVPPLTTVRNPIQALGRIAAQAMLSMIGGERPAPEVPGVELIVRESTAAPAR